MNDLKVFSLQLVHFWLDCFHAIRGYVPPPHNLALVISLNRKRDFLTLVGLYAQTNRQRQSSAVSKCQSRAPLPLHRHPSHRPPGWDICPVLCAWLLLLNLEFSHSTWCKTKKWLFGWWKSQRIGRSKCTIWDSLYYAWWLVPHPVGSPCLVCPPFSQDISKLRLGSDIDESTSIFNNRDYQCRIRQDKKFVIFGNVKRHWIYRLQLFGTLA